MPAFGCVNNTIRLRSGLYLDLADPQPEQFTFEDIAGALSKICRFGAQCDHFYSVAEHSYHCAEVAERDGLSPELQKAALMHDAAEAFVGDCVKPLKIMLPEYSQIEHMTELAIAAKFGIDFWREGQVITEIDQAMLIAERKVMFSADKVLWTGENEVRVLTVGFAKWYPHAAERRFSQKAFNLGII